MKSDDDSPQLGGKLLINVPPQIITRRKSHMNQGEKNGRAVLTEQDVRAVKELLKLGYTQRYIAEKFGVACSTICYINQGKLWKHLGDKDDEQT